MAWAHSMGMIRSRESEFGRASSGPTSLRHRATGSKRIRQTRARPGRQTGCRTSHEFADRGDRQIGKMAPWTRAKSRVTGTCGFVKPGETWGQTERLPRPNESVET